MASGIPLAVDILPGGQKSALTTIQPGNLMNPENNTRGFTLPEILIALGVISILLTLAVPGISSTIKENRLAATLNSIVTDIHFARSEAVKRDVRVILCRSRDPNLPVPTCSGEDRTWTSGYIIFADDGNYTNDVFDNGTDTLLRRGQPVTSGIRLRTNAIWNRNLEFDPDGSTNENNKMARMSICDDRGTDRGRQIEVAPSGIPKMYAKNINSCTNPDLES
jgi:type IV fimbrial biogenesis protein FimT